MLSLKNIKKDYVTSANTTHALKGINLNFRKNEFVSILGPSGCGKTTLLNIIGGLDKYTEGDLIIEGKSTKEYRSRDWDTYRNHSIGFIFQSYNLIMHQNVLNNVELALTIGGIKKKERKRRAIEALKRVGLENEIYKMPNQLSGGQMQRVAIARALINNPEILLADEPTGALDTKTSIQIMDLIKEISKDRLVIMVTHNPDLANNYSSRIIRLQDGLVIDDSNPFSDEDEIKEVEELNLNKNEINKSKGHKKQASMSFGTGFMLSLRNLRNKKGRTALVSFAGSIGIIGIALILSISDGFSAYIEQVQSDTLSQYPITINESATSISIGGSGNDSNDLEEFPEGDEVIQDDFLTDYAESFGENYGFNDLKSFKEDCLENEGYIEEYGQYISGIQYGYNVDLTVYGKNEEGIYEQVYPIDYESIISEYGSSFAQYASMIDSILSSLPTYTELIDNQELLDSQYDVLAGSFPTSPYEAVIMVDEYNRISDYILYALGLADPNDIVKFIDPNQDSSTVVPWEGTFDDLLGLEFKLPTISDTFKYNEETGLYEKGSLTQEEIENSPTLTISGIIRPKEESTATFLSGGVGYSHELTEALINRINDSDVVKDVSSDDTNCLIDFYYIDSTRVPMPGIKLTYEQLEAFSEGYLTKDFIIEEYLGVCDLSSPSAIYIYPYNFEDSSKIAEMIDVYNKSVSVGKEITYTDTVGTIMSSVTTIVNAVTYVLIAFVSISLVVSSIMIGIITYVSVIERTKEIGVLRSLGASKSNISNVFTSETLIIGLVAGLLGILLCLICIIPINIIIASFTSISGLASLRWYYALILVAISVVLTLIAGFIPSKIAARKDPVVALRSSD